MSLDACTEWPLSENNRGYGLAGRGGKLWLAHRWYWSVAHYPIPEGKVIKHSCDNPKCVNVLHLELGTQADNVRDAWKRGRGKNQHTKKRTDAFLED
ncbi:HNH endonuclease signature motif containing protein [Streptomyces formicae]